MVNFPFLIENQYNVKKYLLYFHKNKFERFLRRERNSARAIYLLYKSYSVLIDFFYTITDIECKYSKVKSKTEKYLKKKKAIYYLGIYIYY